MKKLKKINAQLLNSIDFRKVLTREERRRILGGAYGNGCEDPGVATTLQSCEGPCFGLDKYLQNGSVCCITDC